MPKSEVILVDFENKKKQVEKYVQVIWRCLICRRLFEYDSRSESNVKRIIAKEGLKDRNEECVCEDCAIQISKIVTSKDWETK